MELFSYLELFTVLDGALGGIFLWRNLGPAAIIWLGGLQSIDASLYEAAKVDGAKAVQRIRYITLPGLRFVTSYIMLTGIISVMQMFDDYVYY